MLLPPAFDLAVVEETRLFHWRWRLEYSATETPLHAVKKVTCLHAGNPRTAARPSNPRATSELDGCDRNRRVLAAFRDGDLAYLLGEQLPERKAVATLPVTIDPSPPKDPPVLRVWKLAPTSPGVRHGQ